MEKEPKTISRLDLYRQVWKTPITRLAKEYGLSDEGPPKITVGSEEEEPFDGWPYDRGLEILNNRPWIGTTALGKKIVKECVKSCRGKVLYGK